MIMDVSSWFGWRAAFGLRPATLWRRAELILCHRNAGVFRLAVPADASTPADQSLNCDPGFELISNRY